MYEVEYKVEINKEERDRLVEILHQDGFTSRDTITQNDYYVEVAHLDSGGYDFKRYRDEGKVCFYTEKVWENGKRREDEHEISKADLLIALERYPNALRIQKDRMSWNGSYQHTKMHIDMDSVKFDHSPEMRYFIEAEVLTENGEEVPILRDLIISFLKTLIGRDDIAESPGMFNMVFNRK